MTQSPGAIDLAELLLQEGKKREAASLLAAYLKRNPTSARAWWVLSQAVETPAQERDCLERVLVLEPGNAQARARLVQLKAPPRQSVKPFTASLPSDRGRAFEPTPPPPAPKPAPAEWEATTPDWLSHPASDLKPAAPEAKSAPAEAKHRAPVQPKPAAEPSSVPPWAEPPARSAGAEKPVRKPPSRKKFGALDVVMITIILCLLAAFAFFLVYMFLIQPAATQAVQGFAQTETLAALLTERASTRPKPSRTFTPSPSQTPTETATLAPGEPSPTFSPTSLYTPTETPIPQSQIGLVAGRYPPDFTLTNGLTGESVHLYDYIGKQPVVLFFWATWCPYCKAELPSLQSVYEKYQADGLVVLTIDSDPDDSIPEIASVVQKYGITFPVLVDETGNIGLQYAISSIPHHLFIGRSGKIVSVASGSLTQRQLEGQVMSILRVFPTSTP